MSFGSFQKSLQPWRIAGPMGAGPESSRRILAGALRYVTLHQERVLVRLYGHYEPGYNRLRCFRSWKPDGVVLGDYTEIVSRDIPAVKCRAAVFVNTPVPEGLPLAAASVCCDNAAIARMAADFFTRKKFGAFAYVGTPGGDAWSREREAAFLAAVAERGGEAYVFKSRRSRDFLAGEKALGDWLETLPKPCGVFAANDMRARHVLDACAGRGIPVPEHIQVLGVDDDELICDQTVPALSSIVPDYGQGGWLAIETVIGLLDGTVPNRTVRLFGVKGIVERASTQDIGGVGRMVSLAQAFIRLHADSDIAVPDIARAVGASQSLLEKNFRAMTGTTVCRALQERRLALVCRMLETTNTPIARIGEFCGFNDDLWLKRLFRRRFGMTMREWRGNRT